MRKVLFIVVIALISTPAWADVPTSMNIQGRLTDTAGASVGERFMEFTFQIFDAPTGGSLIWLGELQDVYVDLSGLWNARIGAINPLTANVFSDTARWLEVTVGDSANLPDTLPRIRLNTVPYTYRAASSQQSDTAALALSIADDAVTSTSIVNGSIAFTDIGQNGADTGQVMKWNGNEWVADSDSTDGGSHWTVIDSVLYTSGYWGIARGGAGNALGGGWAQSHTNLGVECTTLVAFSTVGGGRFNVAGDTNATVGGGSRNNARGKYSVVAGGGGATEADSNSATGAYSSIGGGHRNIAAGWRSIVAGGFRNKARGDACVVGGGDSNDANAAFAVIGGGLGNEILNTYATICGGFANTVYGNFDEYESAGAIGGGVSNSANSYGTVGGGRSNDAAGILSTIGGGRNNKARGVGSVIGGGGGGAFTHASDSNSAIGEFSTIGGGTVNIAGGDEATICGGRGNTIDTTGKASVISGGYSNQIGDSNSVICGGRENTITSSLSFIGGGRFNRLENYEGVIGGGVANVMTGHTSVIGGGDENLVYADHCVIGGGMWNIANTQLSTIGGGTGNTASGHGATIGGGELNRASGAYSNIPGGRDNHAGGTSSFAAGVGARADSAGAFVWSDYNLWLEFHCDTVNEFAVRSTGGARFVSAIDSAGNPTAGVKLAAGSGAWSSLSDSTLKENVEPVNGVKLLDRLAQLQVTQWNYESQPATLRHIGPMAQDFYQLFGVGEDERYINTTDITGIALAAIQELYKQNQALKVQNEQLVRRVEALEAR